MEIKVASLSKIKNGDIKVVYYVDGVRQMFYTNEEQLRFLHVNDDIDLSPIVMKYLTTKFKVASKGEIDDNKIYQTMAKTIKDTVIK